MININNEVFYIDNRMTGAPIFSFVNMKSVYSSLKNFFSEDLIINYDSIENGVLQRNLGLNFSLSTILIFRASSGDEVFSRVQKINENSYKILSDISKLTGTITVYYPRPTDFVFDDEKMSISNKYHRIYFDRENNGEIFFKVENIVTGMTSDFSWINRYNNEFSLIYNNEVIFLKGRNNGDFLPLCIEMSKNIFLARNGQFNFTSDRHNSFIYITNNISSFNFDSRSEQKQGSPMIIFPIFCAGTCSKWLHNSSGEIPVLSNNNSPYIDGYIIENKNLFITYNSKQQHFYILRGSDD